MTQRASYEHKSAPLSSEFGRKVAIEKFGEALVNSFPVLSRGPRKGQLKGLLCWTKVTVGGWSHNLPDRPGHAGVLRPGTYDWRLTIADPLSDLTGIGVVARWTYVKGGAPEVKVVQTPIEAVERYKQG